jgi:thioredoxin 1
MKNNNVNKHTMITDNLQNLETLVKEGKYLVDFYADWCGPCKTIAPILEKLDAEGDIKVIKVNVDQADPLLLPDYGVRAIPTMIAFVDGKPVNRAVGMQSIDKLKEMFE